MDGEKGLSNVSQVAMAIPNWPRDNSGCFRTGRPSFTDYITLTEKLGMIILEGKRICIESVTAVIGSSYGSIWNINLHQLHTHKLSIRKYFELTDHNGRKQGVPLGLRNKNTSKQRKHSSSLPAPRSPEKQIAKISTQ